MRVTHYLIFCSTDMEPEELLVVRYECLLVGVG